MRAAMLRPIHASYAATHDVRVVTQPSLDECRCGRYGADLFKHVWRDPLALEDQSRLAGDDGFTLIELLVVIVILGILLAIAVPSYLGFKDRANKSAAQANVRAALPAAEAYYGDHGSYTGMTIAYLKQSYDAGLKVDHIVLTGSHTYCVDSGSGGFTYAVTNPGGNIAPGHC